MQNELKYRVGSREIIDLVGALRTGRLTKSPFFQRNLVWRETHKREFIETILTGFPFPQIFLARGKINVDTLEAYTCVVDGQQRLSAIEDYINDDLIVFGKKFSELTSDQKENFVKYEVAVIDFDLDENDERLKDVFRRLNRTFYSLSAIEKLATEFSGSEFLIAARALTGDFTLDPEADETGDVDNPFLLDPSVKDTTLKWAASKIVGNFAGLINSDLVFTNYEASRKVPLMFVLNLIATYRFGSYYNRNDKVKEYLELFNAEFPQRDDVIDKFEAVAEFIGRLGLEKGSFWFGKANFFTMCVEFSKHDVRELNATEISTRLNKFASNVPDDYSLAQREAVNNRAPRIRRSSYFEEYVIGGDEKVLAEGTQMDRWVKELIEDGSLEILEEPPPERG